MAKQVTDYTVTVRVKGDGNQPPTATTLARIIRNKLFNDGYTVTVTAKAVEKVEKESV